VLRERARLAREMHDSLGHALVTVNVKLEAAQRLYARDPRRGDAELEATRALVRAALADLRRTLADLRAPIAGYPDLCAALRRLADEIRATTPIAVNVQRHAGAASATLRLQTQDDAVLLCVDDDGSGIRPADLGRPGHYGILGMRERVEACGGTLHIGPRPGGGTSVAARLPLAGQPCEVER
jgi:signal transduction histidine kinase